MQCIAHCPSGVGLGDDFKKLNGSFVNSLSLDSPYRNVRSVLDLDVVFKQLEPYLGLRYCDI